jgi:two-component system probable response regulator PhcQ
MYNYLKDALAETAWRPAVQKQWSQMRAQDHWRIPLDEAQRMIALSEELMDEAFTCHQNNGDRTDLLSVINACAETVNHDFGEQQIRVTGGSTPMHIPVSRTYTEGIMQRLMEPMSRWAAIGSTLQINVNKESGEGTEDNVAILFEARNCEAGKAMHDCVLFAPALQATPPRASEFLKASLAIGHVGGTISSPPMENGFKQIRVTFPTGNAGGANDLDGVPHQWLQDLSDEYEKWILGTLEVA